MASEEYVSTQLAIVSNHDHARFTAENFGHMSQ